MASMSARQLRTNARVYTVVGVFALFASFPFLWAIVTMFKADPDLYNVKNNPFLYNRPPTLEHLRLLLQQTLLFIPMSRMVASMRLQDTIWALVITYPTFTIPLSVWLLSGFFRSIPRDVEEQAQVDGYSRMQAFVRTVLPLALPGIFTVVVFAFTLTMHEFIYALAFVASSDRMTISVGVPTNLVRGDVFFWQSLMASAVFVAVPVALVYNFLLDRFVQGFTMGAVKG